jgi:alginate O-acetyltransferase complex protein AlgI
VTLGAIALFVAAGLIYSAILPARWRGWALLFASIAAIYILQPASNLRFADYILPTLTVVLTVTTWYFTREAAVSTREDALSLACIIAVVIGMSLMRFVDADYRLTPSRPPDPLMVVLALGITTAFIFGISRFEHRITILILIIIAFFIALKAEPLATEISRAWRSQTRQDTSLASIIDFSWLGFSYVAFRLIHTLRDRQMGLLPALTLREYTAYVLFFPAYVAGPIDRAERFVEDFRALSTLRGLDSARITDGLMRITIGLAKKFVIADTLAQGMALNPVNAAQTDNSLALWILLYSYALRLFFDFSGYTDIAIGVGILFGVRLPENFDRPYLKTNITNFWQSWHKTLSNWVRAYVFSPVSRGLLRRKWHAGRVVLISQIITMVTIGLWHGITVNFFIWGLWHGIGLYVHKLWSDRTRKWHRSLNEKPAQKGTWTAFSWFLTFHYVVLGWVWFALPDFEQAVYVFSGLFGLAR